MTIGELQNKSYEELVQLQQGGKITLVEFVEAQPLTPIESKGIIIFERVGK